MTKTHRNKSNLISSRCFVIENSMKLFLRLLVRLSTDQLSTITIFVSADIFLSDAFSFRRISLIDVAKNFPQSLRRKTNERKDLTKKERKWFSVSAWPHDRFCRCLLSFLINVDTNLDHVIGVKNKKSIEIPFILYSIPICYSYFPSHHANENLFNNGQKKTNKDTPLLLPSGSLTMSDMTDRLDLGQRMK